MKRSQCKCNYKLFNLLMVLCKNLNDICELLSLTDRPCSAKAIPLNIHVLASCSVLINSYKFCAQQMVLNMTWLPINIDDSNTMNIFCEQNFHTGLRKL